MQNKLSQRDVRHSTCFIDGKLAAIELDREHFDWCESARFGKILTQMVCFDCRISGCHASLKDKGKNYALLSHLHDGIKWRHVEAAYALERRANLPQVLRVQWQTKNFGF